MKVILQVLWRLGKLWKVLLYPDLSPLTTMYYLQQANTELSHSTFCAKQCTNIALTQASVPSSTQCMDMEFSLQSVHEHGSLESTFEFTGPCKAWEWVNRCIWNPMFLLDLWNTRTGGSFILIFSKYPELVVFWFWLFSIYWELTILWFWFFFPNAQNQWWLNKSNRYLPNTSLYP